MNYKSTINILILFVFMISCQKKTINIICIGDSITQGKIQSNDSVNELSYRYWLWEMLDSSGYKVNMLGTNTTWFKEKKDSLQKPLVSRYTGHIFPRNHEAFYGINTTKFLNGNFYHDSVFYPPFSKRIENLKPDIALIHLGTNDQIGKIDSTIHNLNEIIHLLFLQNPKIHIILAKLNTPWKAAINHSIDSIAINARNSNSGIKITVIDHASGWINSPKANGSMTYDWAHPNERGQKRMALKWYRAILSSNDNEKPVFNSKPMIHEIQDTSVFVSWSPARENFWIQGYELKLNNKTVNWRFSEEDNKKQCIALVEDTFYRINELTPGTSYNLIVRAIDYAGNVSESESLKFSTTLTANSAN